MTDQGSEPLDRARIDAGLSHGELWLRYFELGGMSTALQVEAVLYGALRPSNRDHDIIAHAINERCFELGIAHSVSYTDGFVAAYMKEVEQVE